MSKSNSNFVRAKVMQDDDTEDLETIPARLQRGFSKTGNNVELVCIARGAILKESSLGNKEEFFAEKTEYTFALPDLTKYPEGFKAFLFKELVESSMLVSLEQEGHLNWWTDMGICDRLLPMVTCGDGNCLLHSASLSMWGFHDRVLALRRALNTVMLKSRHLEAFKRRWRTQQSAFLETCGLILDESEWRKEWELLVEVTSLEPRNATSSSTGTKKQLRGGSITPGVSSIPSNAIYESLEEFHVFILCHIIKRPIIVIASPFLKNSQGENFSPVPFRGIYLPLLRSPKECCTSPLLLAYNLGHFCALAAMQSNTLTDRMTLTIPLVDCEMNLLPIHFLTDPFVHSDQEVKAPTYDFKLTELSKYLDLKVIDVTNLTGTHGKDEAPLIDLSDGVSSKSEAKSTFGRSERRRSSVQSTKYFHPFLASSKVPGLANRNAMCAKLQVKKAPFADDLVKNYLREAQLKYESMTRQKVVQMEEIRRRSREGIQLRHIDLPSSSSSSSSSPVKFLNIFRSNNGRADVGNKLFTLSSKPSASQQESRDSSKISGNLIQSSSNSNVSYRQSAPVGHFDRSPEDRALPVGLVAHEKKDSSGAVKTIQKLLSQGKTKNDKSTFNKNWQGSAVAEGKSKFYATVEELNSDKFEEDLSSGSLKNDRPLILPSIVANVRSHSASSSSPSQCPDEANFSTFPTRSVGVNQKVKLYSNYAEENSSSLPKMKSNKVHADNNWKRSIGFNTSTSDPNISENNQVSILISVKPSSKLGISSDDACYGTSSLPCKTGGCSFFGSWEKKGYCSVCYAERGFENHSTLKDSKSSRNARGLTTQYLKDQQGLPYCRTKL